MDIKIKQLSELMKKGSKIKIKESQKGSFTKYCKGKVTEECIQRGKNSPNSKIRKKAIFAQNARKWKHQNGGVLNNEQFAVNRYNSIYNAILNAGYSPEQAYRVSPFLLGQVINESGWTNRSDNNYGGYLDKDGKRMKFKSEADFFKTHLSNLGRKWPDFINAKTIQEYLNTIHSGKYDYAPLKDNPNYDENVANVMNSAMKYLNKNANRPIDITSLPNKEEKLFQNWYRSYVATHNLSKNPDDIEHYYDWRGYWKNRTPNQIKSEWIFENHLPDKYKLPGHPTFSNESIYSSGLKQGGRWIPNPFIDAEFQDSEYTKSLK